MKWKNRTLLMSLSFVGICGTFLIFNTITRERLPNLLDQKLVDPKIKSARIPASSNEKLEQYKNYLFKDRFFSSTYKKTLKFFVDNPDARDIAMWTALGTQLDSSPEFTELFTKSLGKINENPKKNFEYLRAVSHNLKPEDAFFRGMMLNLANQMNVAQEEKANYFGQEISRPVVLDSEGNLSEDSMNIANAMIFLRDNSNDPATIKTWIQNSLAVNPDPAIKEQILVRARTYFPEHFLNHNFK